MTALADIALPRPRHDVHIVARDGGRSVIHDPATGRRIGLDALGTRVFRSLGMAHTVTALVAAVGLGADTVSILQRLRFLAQQALLEGPRTDRLRRAYGGTQATTAVRAPSDLPLATEAGLRHACQACGSCCSSTDVGPLPKLVVQRIVAHDWSDLTGGAPAESLFREVDVGGQKAWLTQMKDDQCVFLDENRLCRVHARLGVDKKPVPCRQFPYVFTRVGDRIDVSLQMECRAFDRAKAAAVPIKESEGDLRALLAFGAPVHNVPAVLTFSDGIVLSRSDYDGLEAELITALRAVDPALGPVAVLRAYAAGVSRLVEGVRGPIRAAEPFTDEPAPVPATPADATAFIAQFAEFLTEASAVSAQKGLHPLSRRFASFAEATRFMPNAFARTTVRCESPAVIGELVCDVLVAGLFGKEPIRRGVNLELGLAILGLKGVLLLSGAALRARAACRLHLVPQDIVDSMVLGSKLLRERATVDFLAGASELVLRLFVFGFDALTRLPLSIPA